MSNIFLDILIKNICLIKILIKNKLPGSELFRFLLYESRFQFDEKWGMEYDHT